MAALSTSTAAKKVDVYIIAEAFCPNCKEHSNLLDKLVMSKGDDLRKIMDLKLDMMVYDGWNDAEDKGMCEKGDWDCEMAKYHLAGQAVFAADDPTHKCKFNKIYKPENSRLSRFRLRCYVWLMRTASWNGNLPRSSNSLVSTPGNSFIHQSNQGWDFSRCLYKKQDQMIAKYVDEGATTAAPMTRVAKECAASADLDFDKISDAVLAEVSSKGQTKKA